MFGKPVLVVAVAMVAVLAVRQKRNLIVGNVFYHFDNNANRNREQALAYCVNQGGLLAKVDGSVYNMLRLSLPTVGNYWIDGKSTADRFEVDKSCTYADLNLSGIPSANIKIAAASSSCLNLVKGANAASSSISSIACSTELRGVICSIPTSKCEVTTTTDASAP